MSRTVQKVVGITAIVAGVVTGNLQLVLIGASITASAYATPKVPGRQAAATSVQLGEQPRQALFGEGLVGGSLADAFNYGGKYGTDWEVLVLELVDHRVDVLTGFYVGDKFVAFTGNGEVPGYAGKLVVRFYAGTADQAADPVLVAKGGWGTTDRLAGVAYVVVEYKADAADEKHPVFPSGRPQFAWLLRGKRCYDPRKDATVAGGAGAHRWADPATWEWTDNLAVCRYNWARGVYACDRVGDPSQLLVGRGLSAIEAPPERVAAAAALCDEQVALRTGGSEARYRVSALISADEKFQDTEDKWAAACGGVLIQPEGSIEVEPGHAKAPVAFITDADLVIGEAVTFSSFRSEADEEWCNTVIARYVEPTQKWAQHAAPIRRVAADLVADKGSRERTPDLDYVRSGPQAQRIGEIVRRLGRLWRRATITLGPRFSELEEGDWIVWTSARYLKGGSVTFRIEGYETKAEWRMRLTLREIAASVFAWSAADELAEGAVAVQQAKPDDAAFASGPARGAYEIKGADTASPIATSDTTITVQAFRGTLDDARIIDFPGVEIGGLQNASSYRLFYALEDVVQPFVGADNQAFTGVDGQAFGGAIMAGSYAALPMPALEALANPAFVSVRIATTALNAAGDYTPAPLPAAGDGGSGYGGGGRYQQSVAQQ